MRIGELAERSGVSARSLRYYEQHGLISATRLDNGYREFDDAAVERARVLRLLFELGAPRDLAASVLACSGEATPEVHGESLQRLAEFRDDLDAHIEQLQRTRGALTRVLTAGGIG